MSWSTIMVVDDEYMARDLLRLMLERAGYHVLEAVDGVDALTKVKETLPDLMILDVMMPNMDGFTVCRELRKQSQTAALPIIMLSAKTHASAIRDGMEAGANRYLPKPISSKDLIKNIKEVLSEKDGAKL